MRELVRRYFDNGLSRRGFARRLGQLGFTTAAAKALVSEMDASETAAGPARAESAVSSIAAGSGGDLVVAQAKAAGVEYVFTNPGSFEVGFFDSMLESPGLQLIMGLHEGVVISLADGYHRVSLKPAFVNVHVIAGTAQAAGQLYNASRDGSALVITAGLNDNQTWSDETMLAPRPGYDQKDVNRQFTKISWDTRSGGSLPLMLRRALKTAMTPPGGPVYLAMAHYALEARNLKAEILPANRFLLNSRVRPDGAAVEDAARMLIEAKKPVVICGDEVWKSGAVAELITLAEKLGLPVANDRSAYRNFPSYHEHNIGAFSPGSPFVQGADVIFFIGSRDVGGKLVPSAPEFPSTARVIRLGMDTASMSRNYATDVPLVGDVRAGLKDLLAAINGIATRQRLTNLGSARAAQLKAHTSGGRVQIEATVRKNSGQSPMHPDEVGAVLARAINKDAIVVSENITGKYDSFRFGYREDEQMYLTNTGLGLGWGVGAATGAKLAAPDRQVVCTIGDGSVMYSASGFWTQARYAIPVLTVVYNNKNYQTVRQAYHNYRGKMANSGKYVGMYLGDPDIDFVKLAEAQGVKGEKVASGAELESAVKRGSRAGQDGKPYVIEVATARYGGGADSTWHEGFKLAERKKRV
ncbi:MAG TPA: thiamine pyrophosphate-binding protein [Bryobacteraceae bacterium]|nr:thiamine pyrophosphate-binding protein [Bryobacteraceae bacterium]